MKLYLRDGKYAQAFCTLKSPADAMGRWGIYYLAENEFILPAVYTESHGAVPVSIVIVYRVPAQLRNPREFVFGNRHGGE